MCSFLKCLSCIDQGARMAHFSRYCEGHELEIVAGRLDCSACQTAQTEKVLLCVSCEATSPEKAIVVYIVSKNLNRDCTHQRPFCSVWDASRIIVRSFIIPKESDTSTYSDPSTYLPKRLAIRPLITSSVINLFSVPNAGQGLEPSSSGASIALMCMI